MRDIVFTLIVAGILPVSFRRPLIGLLTFSWLAYMRTQDLTWGFARQQRWSFLVAVVTMLGFISRPQPKMFVKDVRCWAMIALAVHVGISILAGDITGPVQLNKYLEYCKVIGVALFTTAVVQRREHLRVLMWVIALSFGFYGIKYGLAGVLSFGRVQILQGPGGMLEDNNDFSLAMCMALPLLLQIGASERKTILRRGVFLMVPLTALTVVMTHSRGGFLSLTAVFLVLVWRSRNRVAGFATGAVLGLAVLLLVPSSYIDRVKSIGEYEQDGSAMGRIAAWKTAINMSIDNPVFGVGMTMFQQHYNQYRSFEAHEGKRVAHNAYLQILAECGAPALILYLFLIFWTFWSLWKLRAEANRHYSTSWIINYATMFETSLVAFVVGSTFLNRAQFDLFYHFVAIVVAFEIIAYREMATLGTTSAGSRTRGGDLRLAESAGFQRVPRLIGFGSRPVLDGTR